MRLITFVSVFLEISWMTLKVFVSPSTYFGMQIALFALVSVMIVDYIESHRVDPPANVPLTRTNVLGIAKVSRTVKWSWTEISRENSFQAIHTCFHISNRAILCYFSIQNERIDAICRIYRKILEKRLTHEVMRILLFSICIANLAVPTQTKF